MEINKHEPFVYNGCNLCTLAIAVLQNFYTYLTRRMDKLKNKKHGKRRASYKALRNQLGITRDLIRIGKQKYTAQRMRRILRMGIISNIFRPIPYDADE
ncbi:unnamed protein product [Caenorhabditis brenneri]